MRFFTFILLLTATWLLSGCLHSSPPPADKSEAPPERATVVADETVAVEQDDSTPQYISRPLVLITGSRCHLEPAQQRIVEGRLRRFCREQQFRSTVASLEGGDIRIGNLDRKRLSPASQSAIAQIEHQLSKAEQCLGGGEGWRSGGWPALAERYKADYILNCRYRPLDADLAAAGIYDHGYMAGDNQVVLEVSLYNARGKLLWRNQVSIETEEKIGSGLDLLLKGRVFPVEIE